MEDLKFYSKKNGQKFDMCKECLTMHVDNYNEDTYLWIIQEADLPWVPSEWNAIREKEYAKKGRKMNGMSVIGKYFSKMRLNQFLLVWKQQRARTKTGLISKIKKKRSMFRFFKHLLMK